MNQPIKTFQFRRNDVPFNDLKHLITEVSKPEFFNKFTEPLLDGEAILLRYKEGDSVNTLFCEVYDNNGTKELHLEVTKEDIKALLPSISAFDKSVVVSPDGKDYTIKVNLNKNAGIESTEKGLGIKIDPTDSLISVSESGIKSNLSFEYDATTAIIKVLGKDNTVLTTIDLPIEQILKSSELQEDNHLKLVFNTSNGDQEVLVDLTKIGGTYKAGSGVEIKDGAISLKLKEAGTTDLVSVKADANGNLYIDNTKLKELQTNLTKDYLTKEEAKTLYQPIHTNVDLGTFSIS